MRKVRYWAFAVVVAIVAAAVLFTKTIPRTKTMTFEKAMQESDSGDLIFFVYDGLSLSRLSGVSRFTHVGIVLVGNDGIKYIVEAHAKGDVKGRGGGVQVYNLEERVRNYKGTASLAKLRDPLSTHQRVRFARDTFVRYRHIPFYEQYGMHYVRNCILSLGIQRSSPGMFCSEFIGHVQKRLGIRDVRERDDCLTPDDLADPDLYEDPVLFHDVRSYKKDL